MIPLLKPIPRQRALIYWASAFCRWRTLTHAWAMRWRKTGQQDDLLEAIRARDDKANALFQLKSL